jgi:superfamily II DNA helicase RecQ
VLVTPEAALGDGFASFMHQLLALGRLDRIFIDECHVMLNESSSFRNKLQDLGECDDANASCC